MKRLLLALAGLILCSTPVRAEETFQASLAGSFVQGSGLVSNGSFQYDGVENIWQQHYTGDFFYKNVEGEQMHFNSDLGVKLDYRLANTYYLQTGVRGEYDNLRDDPESLTIETGGGYKFIHTSNLKLSDEFGFGPHIDKNGTSPVVSNSIWFTWVITPKVTLSNKFLIERGWQKSYVDDDYYTSNLTAITYKLFTTVDLSIQQKYKKEQNVTTNVTLFGLTVHLK
jgi:putative salt-induced outer membrane protein YdiY